MSRAHQAASGRGHVLGVEAMIGSEYGLITRGGILGGAIGAELVVGAVMVSSFCAITRD